MSNASMPVVAIVDPISTGAQLAKFLANLGYPMVRVFSDTIPDSVKALVAEGLEVDWLVTVQHEGPSRTDSTAAALRGVGVGVVLCGSEPGVTLHAELSGAFGRPVPDDKIELRRSKYLQGEAVRAAGLEAVHQRLAHTREDVEEFIGTIERACPSKFKAVVKPVEGAGQRTGAASVAAAKAAVMAASTWSSWAGEAARAREARAGAAGAGSRGGEQAGPRRTRPSPRAAARRSRR